MDKQLITEEMRLEKERFEEKLEEAKLIEQKLTSVPTPSYPVAYCGCDLTHWSDGIVELTDTKGV